MLFEISAARSLGDPLGQKQVVYRTRRKDFPPVSFEFGGYFGRGCGHVPVAAAECGNGATESRFKFFEPCLNSRATIALSLTVDLTVIFLDGTELIEDGSSGERNGMCFEKLDAVRRDGVEAAILSYHLLEGRICLNASFDNVVPIVLGCTEAAHSPAEVVVDLQSIGGSCVVVGGLVHLPGGVGDCLFKCV